jgi:hypothetical protein
MAKGVQTEATSTPNVAGAQNAQAAAQTRMAASRRGVIIPEEAIPAQATIESDLDIPAFLRRGR